MTLSNLPVVLPTSPIELADYIRLSLPLEIAWQFGRLTNGNTRDKYHSVTGAEVATIRLVAVCIRYKRPVIRRSADLT